MTVERDALLAHLATGTTTVCRAWRIRRHDGVDLGFTDHDRDLEFEGTRFRADSGLTARVLEQVSGLAPDNTEAFGVLSSDAITEADIAVGRYDGAEVTVWLVNWSDTSQRMVEFAGSTGAITRVGGAFRVELLGLTEVLNRTVGRVYQSGCDAALGDGRCRFDLSLPGYRTEAEIAWVKDGFRLGIRALDMFAERWFERGTLTLIDGEGAGLSLPIRTDRFAGLGREITVSGTCNLRLSMGDRAELVTGCDRRAATCREKFNNFLNFRGFCHIPGEDWLASYPVSGRAQTGGKRR